MAIPGSLLGKQQHCFPLCTCRLLGRACCNPSWLQSLPDVEEFPRPVSQLPWPRTKTCSVLRKTSLGTPRHPWTVTPGDSRAILWVRFVSSQQCWLQGHCPAAGTSRMFTHTCLDPNPQRWGRAEPGSSVWHPGGHMGVKYPGEPLAAHPRCLWLCSGGCQMGRAGGQRWQRHTRSCFTHFGVKNVTLLGLGGFPAPPGVSPSLFPTQLLMRQFAGARQTQPGCPGPGAGSGHTGQQRGTFGVNMWRVGVPKAWLVASICFSKGLSGSFTHVSASHVLGEREGETHSLSAGSLPWE